MDEQNHSTREIVFSSWVTLFCSMVCLGGILFIVWSVSNSDDMEMSGFAKRDLDRVAERSLGLESQVSEFSSAEQILFRLWGQEAGTLEQVRLWYQEFLDYSPDPLRELYVGILQAEEGQQGEEWTLAVGARIDRDDRNDTPRFFHRVLGEAYGKPQPDKQEYLATQGRLAEEVPGNWFYYQLAGRLAAQNQDGELETSLKSQLSEAMEPYVFRWRTFLVLELSLLLLGLAGLWAIRAREMKHLDASHQPMMEAGVEVWSFGHGIAVLVRGGAVAILAIFLVAWLPMGIDILENWGMVLLYLPCIVLAYWFLWKPHSCSWGEIFGWNRLREDLSGFSWITLGVISLGLIGEWVIMVGGDTFDYTVHWTEWFVPELVWGTSWQLWRTGGEFILLAPLCEEIIFRGIVFRTFKARFSSRVAILGSAFVFAIVHGYGIVAFLAVLWSGCLWAWSYERTGSLIPGMVAHAVNNGLVVYGIMAFFG